MQYKRYLYVCLISLASSPLLAQQGSVPKSTPQSPKKDSVAASISKQPVKPLLAGNLATTPTKDSKYKPVPLAGDKSYFHDMNDMVTQFTTKYLESHNPTLRSVQNNSATPFSEIDKVLDEKNLPKELKYIAVIESALNHNAVSSAGAVGTWQLMEATARMMGLSVNRHKDERRDLVKSTNAATKYLQMLYTELDDWLLVAAAYNCGPTPVERAMQKTSSRSFWDIKQYLPQETQGYVMAFIATASIFENMSKFIPLGSIPVDFKFGNEEDAPPVPAALAATAPKADAKPGTLIVRNSSTTVTDQERKNMVMVQITQPLDMEYTAQELGMDKKTLQRFNPDIDLFNAKNYPTTFYNFSIPKDKLPLFLSKKEMLTKKSMSIFSMNK